MVKKKESKQDRLRKSVEKFKQSKETASDLLELLVEVSYVIRPDSGLLWSQVEDILNDVFD